MTALAYLVPFAAHFGTYIILGLFLMAILVAWLEEWGILLAAVIVTLCGSLTSCQHTLVRKGADGSLTISDGSAASRAAYEETIISVPGLGTVTKKTWAKDQTEVPKKWMFWTGIPGMINAGSNAVETGVDAVDKAIK